MKNLIKIIKVNIFRMLNNLLKEIIYLVIYLIKF